METQFLSFYLENELYLIDIAHIREIISYEEPNPVPNGEHASLGIMDIRGDVLAIFSGRELLSLPPQWDGAAAGKIIILETENGGFGLAVDEVNDIVSLSKDDIGHPTRKSENKLIAGSINVGEQLYIVLDINNWDKGF